MTPAIPLKMLVLVTPAAGAAGSDTFLFSRQQDLLAYKYYEIQKYHSPCFCLVLSIRLLLGDKNLGEESIFRAYH